MREGRKRKGKKPNLGEEARRGEEKERERLNGEPFRVPRWGGYRTHDAAGALMLRLLLTIEKALGLS